MGTMHHQYVSMNGKLLKAGEPQIAALSSASLYGKGVFTTCSIRDIDVFLWEKHWRRLRENAVKLGIDISAFSEELIRSAVDELIRANGVRDGRMRITFLDESPSGTWPYKSEQKTSLLITAAGGHPRIQHFRLTISPYRGNSSSPLAGVKSCNYLENILALDEAKSRGFVEAVRLNERGEIASASMANIFWLREGRLYTPGLSTGCLPGTTREFVLENLECSEVNEPIDSLQAAGAIFLSSAGLGIVAVAEFDNRGLSPIEHPICDLVALKQKRDR